MLNKTVKKKSTYVKTLCSDLAFYMFLQTLTLVLMYYNSGLNDGAI